MIEKCKVCKRELKKDEVGLTRKMINRGATEFFCITCLANYFKVSESALEEKIVQFKEMGCTLF